MMMRIVNSWAARAIMATSSFVFVELQGKNLRKQKLPWGAGSFWQRDYHAGGCRR
jgi:hypothetical protein